MPSLANDPINQAEARTENRLEVATRKGNYEYWLTQEDIADIARLEYALYKPVDTADRYQAFEIIGSPSHMRKALQTFENKAIQLNDARLTLIINIAQLHWVTFVVTSHHKTFEAYYLDTLGECLTPNYQEILEDMLHLPCINLSRYFREQEDRYNCGLWALENAYDLTCMTDEQKGLPWIMERLKRPRNMHYFTRLRLLLSLKLSDDPVRKARVVQLEPQLPSAKQETDTRLAPIRVLTRELDEFEIKKPKLLIETEEVRERFELFVKKFVQDFVQRLGVHAVIAKGKRLTAEVLKNELKTGFTGALLGLSISRNLAGTIPSLVASLRIIGSKDTNTKNSQKITKAFSTVKPGDLSNFLTEAAVEIFQSYERQFMQITDKSGHKIAIEKLAEDAAGRALNYISEKLTPTTAISSELIALGILSGKSETFFEPNLKKVRVRVIGSRIQDAEGNNLRTASLFEKVGLIVKSKNGNPDTFYKKNIPQSTRYGYRRLLRWEKNAEGQLKERDQASYSLENQAPLTTYTYQLNPDSVQQETAQLLQQLSTTSKLLLPRQTVLPKNILFNLRHPIKNFAGRTLPLNTLHQLLSHASKTAVVTNKMAQLSLNPISQPLPEGVQTAISGMGGIGKTQLALEYARRHAADYDHNVLWIDSEKKIDIVESFKKLAIKLGIDLKDAYGNEKDSDQLLEDVYSYFSRVKSLFIFDNVENVKAVEAILPKVSSGNNPTVLITSRYRNWRNVAAPLLLDVFSETESIDFIKNELGLRDNAEEAEIKDLAKLLQHLPLALQQAVAYIKNERNIDNKFTIQHYIDRFKQKGQELLEFNFSSYNNDPYSKTLFTSWKVTLEKLAQDKVIGRKAIEILQIMAYIYPDRINNQFFIALPDSEYLNAAILFLKNYSLINEGSEPHISTIHRLMQTVLRINLERNRSEFEVVVGRLISLTADCISNKEIMPHYYSFLLHMLQHKELTARFSLTVTHKKILEMISYFDGDKTLLFNLFDVAQQTLTRAQYLDFLGEAVIVYVRSPFIVSLMHVLDYIEKNIHEGQISLAETRLILDLQYKPLADRGYKVARFSPEPERSARQRNAIRMLCLFDSKIFSKAGLSPICRRTQKRDLNALCSITEGEALNQRLISDSKIKAYVKKVRLVSNLANFGLLTKDTLTALIQGDFESVAINFALLSSSRVFGKLSNKLLIKGGEQLALGTEKLLLQKELDYDGKVAASLFTDKEILLAGKQCFFGNAMKAAAPFVSKGTMLFFAYNFLKGLRSNQTDSLDNLFNGAIVALDIGGAGFETAEYLGYIAGVSEVTGPIGEALGILLIGGMQLYHVEKELKAIEQWVHLSKRENFVEGIRAFFNFQPSEYLEAKANNHQLANKAIDFLKLHPDMQDYVFSSWFPAAASAKKKFVFLDHKRNLTVLSDDLPEEPREGHLFCLPGIRARPHPSYVPLFGGRIESFIEPELENLLGFEEKTSYLCINAIGVEYTANRTGNATLVALQGDATVISSHSDMIFLINDGNQDYRVGDADNLFILQGTGISGRLQGGSGINIVKFSDYQPHAESVFLDPQGFLCGKNTTTSPREEFCVGGLYLSNITQLHGRENKQDKIFLTQELTVVDTYAGENAAKPDYIYITEKSSKNLTIVVRPDTVVQFLPRNTTDNLVVYKVPVDLLGNASVQLPFNDETQHQFCFSASLENLKALSIETNTISFQLSYPTGSFNLTIQNTETSFSISNTTTTERSFFIQSAAYIFNKNLRMKLLNEKTLYFQWQGNNRIDEIIQFSAPIAHRIDKAMLIQTSQNETIAMGGRQQEILSTDGLLVNHLVGNAGEAVYVIQVPSNSTNPFPLNDISLYNLQNNALIRSTTTDTLDLRALVKKAQARCGKQNISATINEDNQDLLFTLHTNYYPVAVDCLPITQNNNRIAQIRLKNALSNDWYQDLDIILDEHPMNLIFDEDSWKLAPIPLVVTGNKTIIVITDKDITQNGEIFILKNVGEYRFIRYNDTDLLLSNLFSNVTETALYTVLFSQFFQNALFKEKIVSLNVSFLDESLVLREQVQAINNATDFDLQIQSYFNNPSVRPRTRRDMTAPLPIASGSTKVAPGFYGLFTYIPFKMLQFVSLMLTGFNPINNFDLNHRLQEKINLPVYCNKNNRFSDVDCLKNQSALGLLVYCANPKQGVTGFIKNTDETNVPTLSWFAAYNTRAANTRDHQGNASNIRVSLQTDHLYWYNKDGCHQVLHLSKMSNASLATLFPYLPEEGQRWLLAEWGQERKIQVKAQEDQRAIGAFKQQWLAIVLNYIGNAALLHTPMGDYFQALGLRPNWNEHDPSYFLARWLSAIQQLRLGGMNQILTVTAAVLETALLHPKIQTGYSFWWPNTKMRHKKQALRFCADLLQWSHWKIALMPSLLEIVFADYLPIESITWGLRAALSFYSISNDPSYYYLGIALFLLPQLPLLLEAYLGIPVTAYVAKTLETLTQCFFFLSLLEAFKPTPDESRIAQRNVELQAAEQRVLKGRARVSVALKPLVSFFKSSSSHKFSAKHTEKELHYKAG